MRLWRDDRAELERLAALHGAKGSAEEVLHPPGSVPQFADPAQLRDAWDARRDRRVPRHARGHRPGARRRAWASWRGRLDQPAGLYRGLRPEALAMALYIGAQVRALSGALAARRHLDGARRAPTSASSSAATARRPATTRCTRRAGRSTSSAATSRAARRSPSSSCSTGCPCSAGSPGCASRTRSTSRSPRRRSRSSRCSTGYNPVRDRRDPHARRAARGPARTSPGSRSYRQVDGPPARPRRRGRRRARRVLARRADLELPVAQGRAAGARGGPPRDPARPARASAARTSRSTRTGTPTTATSPRRRGSSRTSTCAARRSSCTTGAARSACAWRSSWPTASTGWC